MNATILHKPSKLDMMFAQEPIQDVGMQCIHVRPHNVTNRAQKVTCSYESNHFVFEFSRTGYFRLPICVQPHGARFAVDLHLVHCCVSVQLFDCFNHSDPFNLGKINHRCKTNQFWNLV